MSKIIKFFGGIDVSVFFFVIIVEPSMGCRMVLIVAAIVAARHTLRQSQLKFMAHTEYTFLYWLVHLVRVRIVR